MKERTRILVIRQRSIKYDPRVNREIAALLAAGYEVDVLCARDDGGALRERAGALTVYQVPLPGAPGAHIVVYLARTVAFFMAAALLSALLHLRRRYALVQVHSMPDFLVFAPVVPRLLGARLVLDLHEVMVEFFETRFGTGPHRALVRLIAGLEQASIRFADFAYTCTREMRDAFVSRGADPGRLGVVLNASAEDIFDVRRHPPTGSEGNTFVILCHGSVEERYGIGTAIEAVARLAREMPELRLEIMGKGGYLDAAMKLARERGVADRVLFNAAWVPVEDLCAAIARCDAGLVAMKRDAFRDLTHCNKMYDLVTMRRPVLMSRTRSVQAYFGEDCFEYFDSGDPADLAAAIRRLRRDPARAERLVERASAASEPYRWHRQREVYMGYIAQVLARDRLDGDYHGSNGGPSADPARRRDRSAA